MVTHLASHIDTRLAVGRVRGRDRVRVRISYSQASRVYQPRMAIHTPTSEASHVYTWLRAKLAVCIASAVYIKVWTGYRTKKMSILADCSILNTQIYVLWTLWDSNWNFICVKFGKLNFRQVFVNINKVGDHVMLFVEVCGLSNLMYVKFSQPLQTRLFGVNP